jgi:hypothetical protein
MQQGCFGRQLLLQLLLLLCHTCAAWLLLEKVLQLLLRGRQHVSCLSPLQLLLRRLLLRLLRRHG